MYEMRLVNRVCVTLLGCGALALAACGGDDGGGGDNGGGGDTVDPNGEHYGYVLDSVLVPATPNEASQVALDIDGDDRGDNALGGLLAALASSADLDLQGEVDAQVAAGGVIILADVQATDLSSATGVGLQVFLGGNANPAPCTDENDPSTCGQHLQGGASFDVTMDYDALVVGQIVGGQLSGGPGEVTIELALAEGSTVPVRLVGARVETAITADGLTNGRLGGAIHEDDIENELMPAIVDLIEGILAECDPEAVPCCPEGSTGEQVLAFFDADDSCTVDQAELEENQLISSTIGNPDLDLFDETGAFNPNTDGTAESLSLGVGFSAVSAEFTAP